MNSTDTADGAGYGGTVTLVGSQVQKKIAWTEWPDSIGYAPGMPDGLFYDRQVHAETLAGIMFLCQVFLVRFCANRKPFGFHRLFDLDNFVVFIPVAKAGAAAVLSGRRAAFPIHPATKQVF